MERVFLAGADELIIEGSGDNGISILTGTGSTSRICFGDSGGANQGIIDYSHGTDAMLFKTADTTRLTLTSTGRGKSAFTGLAWAHFDGTGTPSINASHNVADLTDSETGQIRVNFTASLADANYAAVVNGWWGYAYTGGAMDIYTDGFKATTSNGSSYTRCKQHNDIGIWECLNHENNICTREWNTCSCNSSS